MTEAYLKLVGAIHRRQALIVVGAGVSVDASGNRPEASWIGLLRSGLNHLDEKGQHQSWVKGELARLAKGDSDALRLSYLADELRERMTLGPDGRDAFDRWLAEAVKRVEDGYQKAGAPNHLLEAISGLRCPTATTNYDRILEMHSGAASITMDQEHEVAALIRNDDSSILHLHGLPLKANSVVLGRQSYQEHLGSRVKTELQRALSTMCSCLFVGFGEGLRDLNFTPWFRWISTTLSASSIRHYVLLKDADAKLWDTHAYTNISAIAYGAQHSELPIFLKGLKVAADSLTHASSMPTKRDAYLPGMEDQLLREKIIASREAKEDIARAINRFLSDKLIASGLPHYAIKYRIKSLHSIWNKVKSMADQIPDRDPIDLVDQVRDIIGIRIVTLYRADLKHAVREVASWLSSSVLETPAPFHARLDGIKIFGKDMPGQDSASPLAIAAVLRKYFEENNVPVETGPEPVASSYSAFHLICSYEGHDGRRSAFEIQLRSALEDIWSEIEHPLRYKPVDKGLQRAARDATELQHARYHLLSLKTLIDGAVQYADTIRIQLDHIMLVDIRRLAIYTLNKTDRLDTLLGASRESRLFRERFTELFNRQTILLGSVTNPDQMRHEDKRAVSEGLIQLAKEFGALSAAINEITLKRGFDRLEVEIMVRMEEALCLIEGAIRHPIEAEREIEIRSALAAYNKIRGIISRPDTHTWSVAYKSVVFYRLGRLRWHMHLIEDAITLSEQAYRIMIAQVAKNPINQASFEMNLEIAHYLIWMLQERAEALTNTAMRDEDPTYHIDDRKNLWLRMAEISLECIAKLDEQNDEFCNTALFGCAEYAALGSQIWETDVATESQVQRLVERFNVPKVIEGEDTNTIHTAFRVADNILKDRALAEQAAKRLEFLISVINEPDVYQKSDLAQVRTWLGRNLASPDQT